MHWGERWIRSYGMGVHIMVCDKSGKVFDPDGFEPCRLSGDREIAISLADMAVEELGDEYDKFYRLSPDLIRKWGETNMPENPYRWEAMAELSASNPDVCFYASW
jgi:hypothetical protein